MQIPSTKEKFLEQMELSIHELKFNHGFIAPSSVEEMVKKFLSNTFGIKNPSLPSAYGYKTQYKKYFEAIWDRNEVYLNPHLPSGYAPEDRALIMGRQITQISPMKEWINKVENSSNWNSEWFSNLPYHERKYLMLVRGLEDYEKDTPDIQRFRISHIPAGVKFQDCMPILNELYIAHPYKPGVYLPTAQYEHLLFRERIHELSKIMMALGATEIRTIQNSGAKSYSKEDSSSRTSASASYGSAFFC